MQDLLAVCQAVNEWEANSIFYSSNHFNASEQGQSQEPKLSLVGMQCLKLLRTSCTNLKTLELVVHPGNSLGVARNAPIDLRLKDLLSRINEELRRIPLLERVIIRCFGNLDPEVEKMMKDFDWEVDTDQSKPY
ncbi:hypothetical protein IWW34DRAFT_778739 [Fusarium oxysporum f. sp. albedinis]|nr:hypothetical protein IWW34DRAFT_778739 [Fusarium oxysporum f. sp. albedinis]